MKKKKKAPSGMMSHHAWESTYFGSHQQSMQANGYTIRWLLTCLAPLFNLIMHMLDNFTLFNPAWNYWFTECGHGGFIPVHYLPACTEVQMGLGLQIASSHGCDCGVWILSIVPFLHPLVSEQVFNVLLIRDFDIHGCYAINSSLLPTVNPEKLLNTLHPSLYHLIRTKKGGGGPVEKSEVDGKGVIEGR